MSRDNWGRLVAAVVKREQIRQLCHNHSRTPSISTISSDSTELILDTRIESPHFEGTLSKSSVSQDLQNLTNHPKEQSDSKLVDPELPSGRISGREAEKDKQSNLRPWKVVWKRANPSKENELLLSAPDSGGPWDGRSSAPITVVKSVEFSYEELANATNDFNIGNKIGNFVYGSVYYAELRGEKAAIKKMDMQDSRYFLSELKVLTHVYHHNLVHLIGYCVEGSLFLVYEYIENGNLSQHLRGSGREPLPWSTRVQVTLDVARGLEYIHDYTFPINIHRDVKPANILIDKSFHGKVAGFGFTKLTEVGSNSLPSAPVVGTFGYMPPEYAQYGDLSPKVDVYAFGVVIYELISAMEAIVEKNGSATDSRSLVALFDEVLSKPDPSEDLNKLVDPRLGDSCPFDSVLKVAQLARACTHENPKLRPSMRSVVVALMTVLVFI